MTIDPDRNFHIAAAIAAGRTPAEVAAEHGLQPARIQAIAKQCAWMLPVRSDRPIPPGLSIRAAIAIGLAIGVWPTEEDAPEIVKRRIEILKSGFSRRVIMEDIDRWLDRLAAGSSSSS